MWQYVDQVKSDQPCWQFVNIIVIIIHIIVTIVIIINIVIIVNVRIVIIVIILIRDNNLSNTDPTPTLSILQWINQKLIRLPNVHKSQIYLISSASHIALQAYLEGAYISNLI